ncbi:class II Aldolase and Adducin domain protein, partial [Opisthorchis viverrini]
MAVDVANAVRPGQFIESIDVNDPEYIRQLLRPSVIKEDVKLMQQRARVSLILRSTAFRRELEKIVASQMKDGCLNANVAALKQLLDYLTPHTRFGSSNFTRSATMPVLPINDLKIAKPAGYQKGERLVRCKLASVYRMVDIFGWNSGINCHITARVTRDADEYLINPLGLLYHEVTASSLAKVNLKGAILDPGTVALGIDRQGWMLHAAVHEARPDVRCIIHLNTPATIAVSCTNSGLLPISQEAMILGETAVYDPSGLALTNGQGDSSEDPTARRERRCSEERQAIAAILKAQSQDCMLLMIKNHGLLAMGQTIEEAWFVAFTAIVACEAQLRLASISPDELILPVKEAQQAAHYVGRAPSAVQLRPGENVGSSGWRRGELEFEAMMRRLDAAGYHTGHVYRLAQIHSTTGAVGTLPRPLEDIPDDVAVTEPMTPRAAAAYVRKTASLGRGLRGLKDVEIPPAASSFATAYYGDDESRAAAAAEARAKTLSLSRTHWLNTPNSYCRKDIAEIGTPTPKMIAHWTEDIDQAKRRTGGMAVPIDDPNQFAPQGADPYELKRRQRKVKEKYYKDVTTAGPRSRILEGLNLDDEGDLTDGGTSPVVSPRGTLLRIDPNNPPTVEPGHVVIVGAVSKGIISRDHRHNAGIYQSVYAPNPFDRVTDEDLERYRENMDRKAKGLPSLEEEEAASRVEEARKAAEVARQVMEAAAGQPQQRSRFCFRRSFKEVAMKKDMLEDQTVADCSNTLADLSSSILCSTVTSACLCEAEKRLLTRQSTISSKFGTDSECARVTFRSTSVDTLASSLTNGSPSFAHTNKSSDSDPPPCPRVLVRRHSAFRCWYWSPNMTLRSDPVSRITPLDKSVSETGQTLKLGSRFLKRHKTFIGLTTPEPDEKPQFRDQLPASTFPVRRFSDRVGRSVAWRPGAIIRFHHSGNSEVSPCHSGDNTNVSSKSPERDTGRYTSGAEASHDDTEKEMRPDEHGGEKKKKRRFKMPSFSRKSKPKPKK